MIGEGILKNTEEKMRKSIESVVRQFNQIRTGRANPSILENIKVECYNSIMTLSQLAVISAPEPRLLLVQPYDKTIISDIEKAIMKSDLGLQAVNIGNVIRVPIPPLTEERRKEMVKIVNKEGEKGKVSIRNIRRDSNEEIKKSEKDKKISEDESKILQEKIQKLTDKYIGEIDKLLKNKEKEIMEV